MMTSPAINTAPELLASPSGVTLLAAPTGRGRVVASGIPGMTPADPTQGKPASPDQPMGGQHQARILGAARSKPTHGRDQRPQTELIPAYYPVGDARGRRHP